MQASVDTCMHAGAAVTGKVQQRQGRCCTCCMLKKPPPAADTLGHAFPTYQKAYKNASTHSALPIEA